MTRHEIGSVEDFPVGRGARLDVDGVDIAVFNTGEDIFAVGNNCPHKNLPLHEAGEPRFMGEEFKEKYGGEATRGEVDTEECRIRCPWHYLEWDLETGHNEPTNMRIPTYDITIEDGTVLVDI